MSTWTSLLGLGFFLGMRHALDADHLVAVSTIISREKRLGPACVLGIMWGLGHSLMIFLIGAAVLFFKLAISRPVELSLEFAVGLMLLALGAHSLRGRDSFTLGDAEHEHPHSHRDGHHHHGDAGADLVHTHAHSHAMTFGWLERPQHSSLWRSLGVGLIHGLAGSAAVALLVLASVPSPALGAAYLTVFGCGTLAGMTIASGLMESTMLLLARRDAAFERTLTCGTGLLSLAFGAWVIYRVGVVDGLFLSLGSKLAAVS